MWWVVGGGWWYKVTTKDKVSKMTLPKSRNDGTRDTTPATQCTTVISIFIRCLSELTTDTEDLHTLHFNVGLVRITISVTSSTIQTESAGRF